MKPTRLIFLAKLISMVLVLGLAACAPVTPPAPLATGNPTSTQPAPTQPTHTSTPMPTSAKPQDDQSATLPTRPVGVITVMPTSVPNVEEIPQSVLAAVLADLEKRLGGKPSGYTLIRSEAVTWNDGSMGCPKRGVFYTQSLIDGYWVVLQINTQTFDYRVNGRGPNLMLCEQ